MKWNVMSRGRGTTTLAIKDKRVHTAKKKRVKPKQIALLTK